MPLSSDWLQVWVAQYHPSCDVQLCLHQSTDKGAEPSEVCDQCIGVQSTYLSVWSTELVSTSSRYVSDTNIRIHIMADKCDEQLYRFTCLFPQRIQLGFHKTDKRLCREWIHTKTSRWMIQLYWESLECSSYGMPRQWYNTVPCAERGQRQQE